MARYALRHDRTAFFIIFDARTAPAALCADAHGQQALLQHLLCNAGWECPAILDAVRSCDDFYFDAVTQLRMDHWSRGRVALVGDAAFCPSLLAGEGSSLAMAGAYELAGERASSPADHRRAFTGYEATFKPFVDGKQQAALRFAGWFAPRRGSKLVASGSHAPLHEACSREDYICRN